MFLIKRGGDLLAPQLLRRPSGLNMEFLFFLFYHVLHSTHKSSYKYVLHMFPINFLLALNVQDVQTSWRS